MLPNIRCLRIYKCLKVITRSVNFQTRNPREPHFDRKRMLEICKPIYLPDTVDTHLTCSKRVETKEEPHPYEVIMAKEVVGNLETSRMILIYHVNSLTNRERSMTIREFHHQNMSFHTYDSSIMKLALSGTKYQAILHLFDSKTAVAFAPEIIINEALKLNKKLNEKLLLLAGIIDKRFYSKSHLTSIGQVMKRNVHGEMVQQLGSPAASISQSISHHTTLLSHYLSELSKEEKE